MRLAAALVLAALLLAAPVALGHTGQVSEPGTCVPEGAPQVHLEFRRSCVILPRACPGTGGSCGPRDCVGGGSGAACSVHVGNGPCWNDGLIHIHFDLSSCLSIPPVCATSTVCSPYLCIRVEDYFPGSVHRCNN